MAAREWARQMVVLLTPKTFKGAGDPMDFRIRSMLRKSKETKKKREKSFLKILPNSRSKQEKQNREESWNLKELRKKLKVLSNREAHIRNGYSNFKEKSKLEPRLYTRVLPQELRPPLLSIMIAATTITLAEETNLGLNMGTAGNWTGKSLEFASIKGLTSSAKNIESLVVLPTKSQRQEERAEKCYKQILLMASRCNKIVGI